MTPLRTSLVIVLALALLPAASSAQDAAPLIEQGIAARRERRDEDALAAFRRAYELSPTARALAQIALAEQALGRWLDAREHLVAALEAGDDAWIAARRDALGEALASIEGHLGRLAIEGGAAGAEVRVDGVARGALPLAQPLWVSAGRVRVEVHAQGAAAFEREVDVPPGGRASVSVEPAAGEQPLAATSATRAPPPAPGGSDAGALTISGAVSLGLAAAALGVAIGFHAVRESDAQYFESDACAQPGVRRRDACPQTLSAIGSSEVGMGVAYAAAGVLALAGSILVAVGAGSAPGEGALSCGAGPGELGISCGARF